MSKFVLEYSKSSCADTIVNSISDVAESVWSVAPYGERISKLTIVYGAGVSVFCTELASFYQILGLISQHHDRIWIVVYEKGD